MDQITLKRDILIDILRKESEENKFLKDAFTLLDKNYEEIKAVILNISEEGSKDSLFKFNYSKNNKKKFESFISITPDGTLNDKLLFNVQEEDADFVLIDVKVQVPSNITKVLVNYDEYNLVVKRDIFPYTMQGRLNLPGSATRWDASSVRRVVYYPNYRGSSAEILRIKVLKEELIQSQFVDQMPMFDSQSKYFDYSVEYFVNNFNNLSKNDLLYQNMKYLEQKNRARYGDLVGPRRIGVFFLTALAEQYLEKVLDAQKVSSIQGEVFGDVGDNQPDLVIPKTGSYVEVKLDMTITDAQKAIQNINMTPSPDYICILNTHGDFSGIIELWPNKDIDINDTKEYDELKSILRKEERPISKNFQELINLRKTIDALPKVW